MVLSPATVGNVAPEAALAVARSVASDVTDAVVLLRVSASGAGEIHTTWPSLVWFNATAAHWFALTARHVEEAEWFRWAFERNAELWLSLTNVLRAGVPARAEVPFVLRSGESLRLDITLTPLTEDAGSGTRYWTVVANDALNRHTRVAHAVHARRLEVLGLVAGSIAHDFANLVHVISGYTEMALKETAPDEARRSMQVVHDTAQRAAALARQLLQFSRQQPPAPAAIHLGELVKQLLPLLERLAGARVSLTWFVRNSSITPMVWGLVGQLEQVLLNLVVNAREAQLEGGTIRLSVEVLRTEQIVPPPVMAHPHPWMVRLCVEDDGPGIPPTLRDRVLDPFFTTKRNGTGLGLSTVSDIVRQSGGELRLGESVGLRGLRVEVLLPRYEGDDA